ncbi:heme-binding protein [Desertibaculum subflavum]|uniref:heme-binding protein n=1 Tax=Desertibaculum subflavum TaxID=2268458 RepID=UPI000E66731E
MSLVRLALACLALLLPAAVARAQASLTAGEVDRIIGQATQEAAARAAPAIIAVTDRVGNVLGVYEMTGAPSTIAIGSQRIPGAGLQGLENVPTGVIDTELGAIAKAVTGAYLSSAGHAFTTRTASQIVQQFFNVEERGQPGGPLFGVQFSSLPCSDFVISTAAQTIGPKRTPLGLSADPGGFPLYKNGLVVGGIGVISDGQYGLDLRIRDFDRPNDELIALAGQFGFEPPSDVLAFRLTVEGKTLRYSDVGFGHLATNPATATGPTGGAYITVTNYTTAAAAVAGTAYGDAASGFRADAANLYNVSPTPFIVVDNGDANRYAPKAGAVGVTSGGAASTQALTAPEVTQIMASALQIAYAGRAQIRRPLRSFIQVSIAVTDTTGDILAFARTPDAPIFGADVSVQKARSAAFISDPRTATRLNSATCENNACLASRTVGGLIPVVPLNSYVTATQNFFNNAGMLADGIAFGARSIGNLHRPFFPDGFVDGDNGPLSKPYSIWSPFNVGFQLDLVIEDIVLNAVNAAHPAAAAPFCTPLDAQVWGGTALANGLQIFAGGVPIFKNGDLVGAIGVSGDGIDQDDMISFLGVHNAGVILGSGVGNAPGDRRANNLSPKGVNLRYVSCPFAPFNGSRDQDPCGDK